MKMGRAAIISLVLFFSIGCDQVTKIGARKYLQDRETMSFLGDTFRLTYVENHGAFLGLGSTLPELARTIIFTVFVTGFLIALLVWVIRTPSLTKLSLVSLSLLAGGGIGNVIDRLIQNGGVTDFMNMGIGPVRTGIFNVADVWIVIGAALLFFSKDFRDGPKEEEGEEDVPESAPAT